MESTATSTTTTTTTYEASDILTFDYAMDDELKDEEHEEVKVEPEQNANDAKSNGQSDAKSKNTEEPVNGSGGDTDDTKPAVKSPKSSSDSGSGSTGKKSQSKSKPKPSTNNSGSSNNNGTKKEKETPKSKSTAASSNSESSDTKASKNKAKPKEGKYDDDKSSVLNLEFQSATVLSNIVPKAKAAESKLYVSDINDDTKASDLQDLFAKHAKIIDAKIIRFSKIPNQCFGLITFENDSQIQSCIKALNKTVLKGNTITVSQNSPLKESSNSSTVVNKLDSSAKPAKKSEESANEKPKSKEESKSNSKKETPKDSKTTTPKASKDSSKSTSESNKKGSTTTTANTSAKVASKSSAKASASSTKKDTKKSVKETTTKDEKTKEKPKEKDSKDKEKEKEKEREKAREKERQKEREKEKSRRSSPRKRSRSRSRSRSPSPRGRRFIPSRRPPISIGSRSIRQSIHESRMARITEIRHKEEMERMALERIRIEKEKERLQYERLKLEREKLEILKMERAKIAREREEVAQRRKLAEELRKRTTNEFEPPPPKRAAFESRVGGDGHGHSGRSPTDHFHVPSRRDEPHSRTYTESSRYDSRDSSRSGYKQHISGQSNKRSSKYDSIDQFDQPPLPPPHRSMDSRRHTNGSSHDRDDRKEFRREAREHRFEDSRRDRYADKDTGNGLIDSPRIFGNSGSDSRTNWTAAPSANQWASSSNDRWTSSFDTNHAQSTLSPSIMPNSVGSMPEIFNNNYSNIPLAMSNSGSYIHQNRRGF